MILINAGVQRTGSTWLEAIFHAIGKDLGLQLPPRGPETYRAALDSGGLEDGRIYTGVFLPWEELQLADCRHPYRVLHVRRDPRDILVSLYYSLRESHVSSPSVNAMRPLLQRLPFEDGLLRLLDNMEPVVAILHSYLGRSPADGCHVHEFSEITADPVGPIRDLLGSAGLHLPQARLRKLLEERDFRALSGGRDPGEERADHHYRRGITGDWREKFSPRLVEAFRSRFGASLVRLGYEEDLDWTGGG